LREFFEPSEMRQVGAESVRISALHRFLAGTCSVRWRASFVGVV